MSPYADELAAKTTRRTRAWRATSRTTVVPCTPESIVACGFSTERTTLGMAASWKTTSTPSMARATVAGSTTLPSMSSTLPGSVSMFWRRPLEKSSSTRTRSP